MNTRRKHSKLNPLNFLMVCIIPLTLLSCNSESSGDEGEDAADTTTVVSIEITDEKISDAVKRQLIQEPGVEASSISVTTLNGIVELDGSTEHLLGKDRAGQIASMVKGVRAVINNIDIPPTDRSPERIREDVESALASDPATDEYEIVIETNGSKITLSGVVDSWRERKLAEMISRGVRGVMEVENNIVFNYPEERTDSEMQAEIEKALKWDVFINDGLIDVKVENGIVDLSGVVGTAAEHSAAVTRSWVAGITEVNAGNLEVQPWTAEEELRSDPFVNKTDSSMREAVKDVFTYDPRVSPFEVTVKVDEGNIYLSGSVDNLSAKNAAAKLARNVVGVRMVENNIAVEPKAEFNDAAPLEDIRKSISWDPYLDDDPIDIKVNDGVAFLTGEVENYFEKLRAEDIAARTNGVSRVTNNIQVADNSAAPYVYDFEYYAYHPFTRELQDPVEQTLTALEIKEKIEEQMFWSPFVTLNEVNVEVENARVILTGEVDSWTEYNYAEKNAYDGGAVIVDNNLTIGW